MNKVCSIQKKKKKAPDKILWAAGQVATHLTTAHLRRV